MEENHFIVYMHENKLNHKKYIGITGKKAEQRWQKGKNYRTCTAFNRAIQKYGWDGFEHIILFTGQTEEEACQKEIELIAEYKTQDPDYGYNIAAGGGGTTGMHHTEEMKSMMSERFKGPNNPNYGKPLPSWHVELLRNIHLGSKHTEEHKKKIGDSLRGRHYGSEKQKQCVRDRCSHPVMREDGVIFPTVKEAAACVGVTYTAISNAIRRNNKCGGYHWEYVEKPNDHPEKEQS